MKTYEIPRNYKGESRILYVFSTKAIVYTAIGLGVGLIFYFLFNLIGLTMLGIIITLILGIIGFSIATFKVPDIKNFEITKKTSGENIDDVIKRWISFKRKKKTIYVYADKLNKEEETKDE